MADRPNIEVESIIEGIARDVLTDLVSVKPGGQSSEHRLVWAVTGMVFVVLYFMSTSDVITLPGWAVGGMCVLLPMPVMVYTICRTWLKARGVAEPPARQEGPDAVGVGEIKRDGLDRVVGRGGGAA